MTQRPDADPAIPAATVAALESRAVRRTTPHGGGQMTWRIWGEGPPVVLVHGGSGSWTHWFRTIPALARRYRLLVADLAGLGTSDMPPEPLTPAHLARIMAEGLGILLPDERFHLVGFSFGGHVCGLAALALEERIRTFTIIGVASLGVQQMERQSFAKERPGMSYAELAAVHRRNLEILMFKEPSRIDHLAVHLQVENIRQARFRSKRFAANTELRDALRELRLPLRTIWGADDQTAWPSVGERVAIIGEHHPELLVRLVPDAGHWVMYEQPDAFNAALVEMIEAPVA